MTASTDDIVRALSVRGRPRSPRAITQKPFDYNEEALQRLADPRIERPSDFDLGEYALDLRFVELQPDLFAWVFPRMMEEWRRRVMSNAESNWIDELYGAMVNRPSVFEFRGKKDRRVVYDFMGDVLIDRIDAVERLSEDPPRRGTHALFGHLSMLGVISTEYPAFWDHWWDLSTDGRCRVALQWASAVLFFDEENPIFHPWTLHGGGGVPLVWPDSGAVFDVGWREANVEFIRQRVTVNYLRDRVQHAADRIRLGPDGQLADLVVAAFDDWTDVVTSRLAELPTLLRLPKEPGIWRDWSV